jgi:hypothetical protein
VTIRRSRIWNYSTLYNPRLFDEEVYQLKVEDNIILNMTEENLRPTPRSHYKQLYH